jgi:hypothetical protein
MNNYLGIVSALQGFDLPVPQSFNGPVETVG